MDVTGPTLLVFDHCYGRKLLIFVEPTVSLYHCFVVSVSDVPQNQISPPNRYCQRFQILLLVAAPFIVVDHDHGAPL